MGFDAPGIEDKDRFIIPVSDTQAYKQFGNSVVVPVIKEIARLMVPHIRILQRYEQSGILELPLFADAG
jgi:DNA (cytosine-5)-methyltransferase 1